MKARARGKIRISDSSSKGTWPCYHGIKVMKIVVFRFDKIAAAALTGN